MGVGAEIYTPTGILQLGQETSPFTLVESGTFTLAYIAIGANPYLTTFTIPASLTAPLIAVLKDDGTAVWVIRGEVIGADRIISVAGLSIGTGKYYVFDFMPTGSPANFGLEIYSAAGALLYNSGIAPPMRIVGFGTSLTGRTAGRTYAAIMSGLFPGTFTDSVHGTLQTIEVAAAGATSVIVSRQYLKYTPPPGFGLGTYEWVTPVDPDSNPLVGKALMVDVTDLIAV